jgi:hypothetical protein
MQKLTLIQIVPLDGVVWSPDGPAGGLTFGSVD